MLYLMNSCLLTDLSELAQLLMAHGSSTTIENTEGDAPPDCAKPAFRRYLSREWDPVDICVTPVDQDTEEFATKLCDSEVTSKYGCKVLKFGLQKILMVFI